MNRQALTKLATAALTAALAVAGLVSTPVAAVLPAAAKISNPYYPIAIGPSADVPLGPDEVNLAWGAPLMGADLVTGYEIRYSDDGGASWVTVVDDPDTELQEKIYGLVVGEKYIFQIRAVGATVASGWVTFADGSDINNPNPTPTLVQITGGASMFCALNSKAQVVCWGANNEGKLGIGTQTYSEAPTVLPDISNAVQVSSSDYSSCALLATGAVKCWGWGDSNRLGTGNTSSSSSPVSVIGVSNAIQVSVGLWQICALIETGEIKCWGSDSNGGLGDGPTYTANSVATVSGIDDAVQITSGEGSSCALLESGIVKCWGNGYYGTIGNGSVDDADSPAFVTAVDTATAIWGTSKTFCASLTGGTVKCWGSNERKLIRGNIPSQSTTPLTVSAAANSARLYFGSTTACVQSATDGLQCWGNNQAGQLGNGTSTLTDDIVVPVGLGRVLDFMGTAYSSCAIEVSGALKCWGNNSNNQVAATGDSVFTPAVAYGIDGDAVEIKALVSAPGKVSGIKGVSGVKSNTVSFKAAAANGAVISKYEIKWKLSTSKKWSKWFNLGKKTKTVIKGWAKGKKYQVQVRATNTAGSSLSSVVTIRQTK